MKKFILFLILVFGYTIISFSQTLIINLTNGQTVEIEISQIESITFDGDTTQSDISEIITKIPIKLLKNYPNPFNPTTTISFELSEGGKTSIIIYNLKGQKVKTILNEKLEKGKHTKIWDGKNDKGKSVASGTYFYKITVNGKQLTKKMILIK